MTHDQLQAAAFEYGWNTYPQVRPLFFAIFNEVVRWPGETDRQHMIRISRMKSMGLVPGVFDLMLIYKSIVFVFDIKVGADKLSDAQKRFGAAIMQNNGQYFTFSTLDEFKLILKSITVNL